MASPFEDALAACSDLMDVYENAVDQVGAAQQQLEDAREAYDEAGEFFDDSTAWDASLGVGAVVVCAAATLGWCLVGVLAGGLGVAASEGDRQDEISAAEEAVQNAEILLELAENGRLLAWNGWWNCFSHELAKGIPP